MKAVIYFSHDSNARNDIKIKALRQSYHNMAAYGRYWVVIEMLREQKDYRLPNTHLTWRALAEEWRCKTEEAKQFLETCFQLELFTIDDDYFYSKSLMERMYQVDMRIEQLKRAAEKSVEARRKKAGEKVEDEILEIVKQSPPPPAYPIAEVIEYLNEKTGSKFSTSSDTNRSKVKARFREGYSLNDFKTVIDEKVRQWLKNPDMARFLRPETLFGTKFDSYLNEGRKRVKPQENTISTEKTYVDLKDQKWKDPRILKNG